MITHLLRRLSCTMHSTLSHLQLPHGAPSTTSHLTFRLLQLMQALAALRLVILAEPLDSEVDADRFFDCEFESDKVSLSSGTGEGRSVMVMFTDSSACCSGERTGTVSPIAIL